MIRAETSSESNIMAVLWQKQVGDTRYEVRSAGNSRRLYTDGVFHSQYNRHHPVTGSIWDLLFIPAFFYAPDAIRRVLVLGVGGGAVIQQLRHFLCPDHIVGVELEPVHLQVARRFFGVRGVDVELHQAEARAWLEAYKGPAFDMIVDDLFGSEQGEPVRAIAADHDWMRLLGGVLSAHGLLVSNFTSRKELKTCAYFHHAHIARQYPSAFQLSTPQNENVIGVFLRRPAHSKDLRRQLAREPALDTRRRSCRLRYRLRRL